MIVCFVFENVIDMNGYDLYKNYKNNFTWLDRSTLYSDNIPV